MPEVAPAAAAAAAPAAQQRGGGNIIGTILRMAFFYYISTLFKGGDQKGSKDPESQFSPLYAKGSLFDIYTYVTEAQHPPGFRDLTPIWVEKGLGLATSEERTYQYTYRPSQAVQNNGSVFLHLGFVETIKNYDEQNEAEALPDCFDFVKTFRLNYYMAKPKNKTGLNLLTSDSEQIRQLKEQRQNETQQERVYLNYWKPSCSVVMVDHFSVYPKNGVPPQLRGLFDIDESDGRTYFPLVAVNDFWLLKDKYITINDTVDSLPLNLSISTQNFWIYGIQQQIDQSFQVQASSGLSTESESDEFKRVLIEGNPYLLVLTFVVSMLHTVFDMLAFKNDIGFWKENKSMEGLSARSVVINAGCQLVIFLYLLDNETSFVVLLSSAAGTAIEFWKVTKAMDVSVASVFPYIKMKDRASYSTNKTKQYDEEASKYLSYVLYPLVFGYSIYTLYYQTHKSWYSWILGSLVGAVYMFGFILMCPQLYLNYKLKSVAHLPWRQMTYKFLNTIIDDLFAFVIKMPTLHRLSVFRDDLVFLIFIYQRWIYRVDKSRVNEFGYVETKPDEADAIESDSVPALEGEGEQKSEKAAEESEEAKPEEASKSSKKNKKSKAGVASKPAAEKKNE